MTIYAHEDLDRLETKLGTRIPPRLARFLETRGPGEYGDVVVHKLDGIQPRYAPLFAEPTIERQLFSKYLPFALNVRKNELWVLDVSSRNEPLFAKIDRLAGPKQWPEAAWAPFEGLEDDELAALEL